MKHFPLWSPRRAVLPATSLHSITNLLLAGLHLGIALPSKTNETTWRDQSPSFVVYGMQPSNNIQAKFPTFQFHDVDITKYFLVLDRGYWTLPVRSPICQSLWLQLPAGSLRGLGGSGHIHTLPEPPKRNRRAVGFLGRGSACVPDPAGLTRVQPNDSTPTTFVTSTTNGD